MKPKTILFSIIALFLLIDVTGCEKELSETELMKQQIIGTWEWTVSYGGVIGEQKPIPGEKLELIFTDDRILATHNMEIIDDKPVITDNKKVLQDGIYVISREQDKFYITITPKEGAGDLLYLAGKGEILLDQIDGYLIFPFSIGTAQFARIYRRVNE
ncbi:hypothetical protein [Proteiniphilum sp. X52]|uniref:hypothetical protein n=1 Tax=Proteiniphilum sp. X52 TaxID=2382159 RepID=UPI000F0A71FB|nr:hypothetical protein [Proteiniphilum sp. X52]RNC63280.1 hypothetical protein D7D25_17355 [Proteiniphilum sp. X52]